jgi:hypothetical protein
MHGTPQLEGTLVHTKACSLVPATQTFSENIIDSYPLSLNLLSSASTMLPSKAAVTEHSSRVLALRCRAVTGLLMLHWPCRN